MVGGSNYNDRETIVDVLVDLLLVRVNSAVVIFAPDFSAIYVNDPQDRMNPEIPNTLLGRIHHYSFIIVTVYNLFVLSIFNVAYIFIILFSK